MIKSKKKLYAVLTLQISAAAFIIAFFFIDFETFFEDTSVFIEQDKNCNLKNKPCTVNLDANQSISLNINPKGIPLMKTLSFDITTKGIKTKISKVKIYAINMEMGTYKLKLKKLKNDRFTAKQILPACIVGNMIWHTDISFEGSKKGVRFIFRTDS